MEFKEYQHIQKLGTSEVDGILNGKCYISYKIDGTNSLLAEKYPIEYQISKMLTEELIFKEYSKLIADKGFWEIKFMPALLNQVFIEFFKNNWEIILKKFRNPIIDFKALRSICNDKVKLVLNFNR